MRRAALAAVSFAALVLSTGCGSQLGLGRARTLDHGRSRIGFGLEGDFLAAKTGEEKPVPAPWVQAGIGARHGVTDRFELGGRVWGMSIPNVVTTVGVSADAKVAVLRPPPKTGSVNLSSGLSLAYHQPHFGGLPPFHVFGATLPVLVGVTLGRHELVLGPRIADYLWTGYGQNPINAFYAGGSAGVVITTSRTFELNPEVVAMYSDTSFNGEMEGDRRGVMLVQAGVGGSFDL